MATHSWGMGKFTSYSHTDGSMGSLHQNRGRNAGRSWPADTTNISEGLQIKTGMLHPTGDPVRDCIRECINELAELGF